MKYIETFESRMLKENKDELIKSFLSHYISEPMEYKNRIYDYIYTGVENNRNIEDIKSWTLDEETALVFSTKYNNGAVHKIKDDKFIEMFNFISLDVLYDYLENHYDNNLEEYVSESEIYVINNKKVE